jgi:hypothetical protein
MVDKKDGDNGGIIVNQVQLADIEDAAYVPPGIRYHRQVSGQYDVA